MTSITESRYGAFDPRGAIESGKRIFALISITVGVLGALAFFGILDVADSTPAPSLISEVND